MSRINDASRVVRWAIETGVRNYGIDDCDELLDSIMSALHENIGGGDLYLPKFDKAARDSAIRAEFDGRNKDELCQRYQISKATLMRIVGNRSRLP